MQHANASTKQKTLTTESTPELQAKSEGKKKSFEQGNTAQLLDAEMRHICKAHSGIKQRKST